MFRAMKNQVLLFVIFSFALVYRVILMFWQTYPPGADIGLHNSLIHSITQGGNVNFLWNSYHMGGGISNTFPGYHIFASFVIIFTGLPDYLAQAFVAILFSSLLVFVAFLITKKLLNESIALIVAFLVGVSYYDIFMILWSGYPNIVTLMLIPLAFYLLLEKPRFSRLSRLAAASLLSAAIFLTHSLSSFMFVTIVFVSVFIALCFPRRAGFRRPEVLEWLAPLFIGGLLVSPFLVQAAPLYLNFNSALYNGGLPDIQKLLLPDRLVPLQYVLPFFVCCFLSIVFLKFMRIKLLQSSNILLVSWLIIGTVLTQAYVVGIYTDYERFLYFADLPLIIIVAMGIFLGAHIMGKNTNRLLSAKSRLFQNRFAKNKILQHISYPSNKTIATLFAAILIIGAFLALPNFSMTPTYGLQLHSQLQVMTQPGYEAIQWIKDNTSTNSVFVADPFYAWWLGGFAQRPTIGAVEPYFITNSREFEPALLATRLLDTDYLVDNGLIQVREDGGYGGMRNPEFLVKLKNAYYPYPFCNFNNSQTIITFKVGEQENTVKLVDVPVKEMYVTNSSTEATISVIRGNNLLNFTQKATVYQGVRFVNITQKVSSDNPMVNFADINLVFQTRGNLTFSNTGTIGFVDSNAKLAAQLIFKGAQPQVTQLTNKSYGLLYDLNGKSETVISFYVSTFDFPNGELNLPSLNHFFLNNTQSYADKVAQFPIDVFDYQQAITNLNASYIVIRDSTQIPRFANDPNFSLIFINKEVAIFHVK